MAYDPGRQWLLTQMRDPSLPIEARVEFAIALVDYEYYQWSRGFYPNAPKAEMYRQVTLDLDHVLNPMSTDVSKILKNYGH